MDTPPAKKAHSKSISTPSKKLSRLAKKVKEVMLLVLLSMKVTNGTSSSTKNSKTLNREVIDQLRPIRNMSPGLLYFGVVLFSLENDREIKQYMNPFIRKELNEEKKRQNELIELEDNETIETQRVMLNETLFPRL